MTAAKRYEWDALTAEQRAEIESIFGPPSFDDMPADPPQTPEEMAMLDLWVEADWAAHHPLFNGLCHLCGEPMGDEDGETHYKCCQLEQAWADQLANVEN